MPRPVRHWFRFYVEAFGDRKIRRLKPAQRWVWVAVLGAARDSHEPGALYIAPEMPMTAQELADFADVPLRDVSVALGAMEAMSMISRHDGVIYVTNWGSRQFESDNVTARTREHRERSQERSNDVPGNGPETETETETEVRTTSVPRAGRSDPEAPPRFEEFWTTYDHKVGRRKAEAAYRSALKKPGVTDDLLIAAAGEYVAWVKSEGKHPQFTKHPTTWLNGEHWRDERVARQRPRSNVQAHLALAQQLADEDAGATVRQIGGGR